MFGWALQCIRTLKELPEVEVTSMITTNNSLILGWCQDFS